jgi:hypothetical protein
MGTVLVTDHDDQPDLAERLHAVFVVEFLDEGIDPFQHPLCHAGGLPEPYRRCYHDDVGAKQFLAQRGPGVAASHVMVGPRLDVVVDRTDDLGLEVEFAELGRELPKQFLGGGRLTASCGFERAIERKGFHRHRRTFSMAAIGY